MSECGHPSRKPTAASVIRHMYPLPQGDCTEVFNSGECHLHHGIFCKTEVRPRSQEFESVLWGRLKVGRQVAIMRPLAVVLEWEGRNQMGLITRHTHKKDGITLAFACCSARLAHRFYTIGREQLQDKYTTGGWEIAEWKRKVERVGLASNRHAQWRLVLGAQ